MANHPRLSHIALAALLSLATGLSCAEIINLEFKFTPFIGDLKQDHVDSVAGKANVFINRIPILAQEIDKQELPVLFDDREVSPAVWIPIASIGSAVRKGKNAIRIEFMPANAAPYQAQFSWAAVNDSATEKTEPGSIQATNQSGEGKEAKQGTGKMIFEREFIADFANDRPWHHYPAITALTAEDKQQMTDLLKTRTAAFKPKFEAIYPLLESNPVVNLAEARKSKCLDQAYAAGVRMTAPAPDEIEFVTTGNPEVVIRRKDGNPVFQPNREAFERIKGEKIQMCAGILLSIIYPVQLIVVRKPDGNWIAAE